MRRPSIGSRWSTPDRRYTGSWRQNPWINAVCVALQGRSEAGGSSTASTDAATAADREPAGQPGSDTSRRNDSNQDRQQRAAVRTWENEGGSLGAHPGMGR
jgi:hypothetical protein